MNSEERRACMHREHQNYVARFERWSVTNGWVRYLVQQPLAALTCIAEGRVLPSEWCQQPLSEWDYLSEKAAAYMKSLSGLD